MMTRLLAVGSLCLSGRQQGQPGWVVTQLLSAAAIGGSVGFMASLGELSHHPLLSSILSGALGASGAFGFEFLAKQVASLQPP